jgi:SNF2 family DNA or RNA helicase
MFRLLYPGQKRFLKHQQEALAYAKKRDQIGLFLDMRLGKTPVAIRWAILKGCQKVLIVAPLSVLPGMQWHEELKSERCWPIYIWPEEQKDVWIVAAESNSRGWFGINYEAVRTRPEILRLDWDCIILDESTRIRNPKAQITKSILKNTDHVKLRCILSGLPNPESPLDFFCQMQFLHGEFLGFENYWAFRQSKFYQPPYDYSWHPKKGVREAIKERIHSTCFIRSRKETGLGNRRIFERRYVEMTPDQKRIQMQIRKDFAVGERTTKWVPVQQMWLARLAGGFDPELNLISGRKFVELLSIVKDERPNEQIVVWFRFNKELQYTKRLLRSKKVSCDIIQGKTDKAKRPIIQKRFHESKFRILLMQVKVGQYGLNLSCANTAIYFSNAWDHEIRSQSQERIEHMGKHVPLLFIDLITRHSIDEAVLEALQDKKAESKSFLRMVMDKFIAGMKKVA